jgi:hypothetical protein
VATCEPLDVHDSCGGCDGEEEPRQRRGLGEARGLGLDEHAPGAAARRHLGAVVAEIVVGSTTKRRRQRRGRQGADLGEAYSQDLDVLCRVVYMMVAENYKYHSIVISTGRQTGVVIHYRVRTVHRDPTGDRTRDRTTTSSTTVSRVYETPRRAAVTHAPLLPTPGPPCLPAYA